MTEPDDNNEPIDVTDKQLNDLIDAKLSDARPERYNDDDRAWMDPVYQYAAEKIAEFRPAQQILDVLAHGKVNGREGQQVKQTHAELRKIGTEGKLPLGWGDEDWHRSPFFQRFLRLPLSIGGERVRWGAMTATDWTDWIRESQEAGDKDAARRIDERKGARFIERMVTEQHANRTEDIRPPQA